FLWRENQSVQTDTVARANHFFAPLKRDIVLDRWLITRFVSRHFRAALPPEQAGYFPCRIANKSSVGRQNLQEESSFTRRKYFDSILICHLQVKLFAFTKEGENEVRI